MKVYELMERLAGMPAGAEIVASTTMTDEELCENEVLEQTEAGENLYSVTGRVDALEKVNDSRVYLYMDLRASV